MNENTTSPTHISGDLSRVDQVLKEMERLLLTGELRLGDRIRESKLASEWGTSRSVVREACRILQQAGVLEIVANRGSRVKELNVQDVLNIYDIRATLWRLAAKDACRLMTRVHRNELSNLIDRIEKELVVDDRNAYLELNSRFHDIILELSGNRPLIRVHKELSLQARLVRRFLLSSAKDLRERNQEHRDILSALWDGDGDLAGELLANHSARGKSALKAQIQSGNEGQINLSFNDDGIA